MLNEINFQRKKVYLTSSSSTSSIHQTQPDQQKNIYDFVLKHDSLLSNIEKDLSLLKSEMSFITAKFPLLEKRNDEIITKSDLDILIPTLPTKEEIKAMLKCEVEKNETFSSFSNEINNIKNDNICKYNELSQVIENIKELNSQQIQSINQSKLNVNINEYNQQFLDFKHKINDIIQGIKKHNDHYVKQINNKLSDIDNDFNRLIESLKTQFQNINDLINQVDISKVNIIDIKQLLTEYFENQEITTPKTARNFNEDNQIKTQHILSIPSISTENMNLNSNRLNSKSMKHELTVLKNEINNDFERINTKILQELQNQANDIKQLYQEIHSLTTTKNLLKPNDTYIYENSNPQLFFSQNYIDINNELAKHANFILQLDQELSKKANIDQLNYALEAQAKINDALCNANKIARWSWNNNHSFTNKDCFIIWTIQNINTSLDVFSWETNNENIYINLKGMYRISAGVVLNNPKDYNKNKQWFWVVVNGKNDMEGIKIAGGIVFVEGYLQLNKETKIQFKLKEDLIIKSREAFLEIKKLI